MPQFEDNKWYHQRIPAIIRISQEAYISASPVIKKSWCRNLLYSPDVVRLFMSALAWRDKVRITETRMLPGRVFGAQLATGLHPELVS
jgi:hypothetical protein